MIHLQLRAMVLAVLTATICCAQTEPAATQPSVITQLYESLVTPAAPDNKPNYRIPAIVLAPNGDLLAFMERRVEGIADMGRNQMVLRRSVDQGKTWGSDEPLFVTDEYFANSDNVPLVDSRGRIWNFFVKDRKQYVVMASDDSGKTWTSPKSIHEQIIPPEWDAFKGGTNRGPDGSAKTLAEKKATFDKDYFQHYGVGCGSAAVELRAGPHASRIVVPARAMQPQPDGSALHATFTFYSDDHGDSWHRNASAIVYGNECELVELANGRLLMNSRDSDDRNKPDKIVRRFALSDDGGDTWKEQWTVDLQNPQVFAATKRYTFGGRDVLLYCSPYSRTRESKHPYGRRNLSLMFSTDEGKTWSGPQTIFPGNASYSEMICFPDGTVGVIYERGLPGTTHYWDELAFARLTIDWNNWHK